LSQAKKLLATIRNNPKDVRFDDACKAAELLGFTAKGNRGTSHHVFARPGERVQLNFQRRGNGKIVPYQAHQLINMIDKYEDDRRG
jgi:hypothetical protein